MVHKFVDFECSEMPDGLEAKLRENELFTYRDMVLKEHLFSIDTIREKMDEESEFFNYEEVKMLYRIQVLLDNADCGYFRFVSN